MNRVMSFDPWKTKTDSFKFILYKIQYYYKKKLILEFSSIFQLQNIKRRWLHGTFCRQLFGVNIHESQRQRLPALRQIRVPAQKGK